MAVEYARRGLVGTLTPQANTTVEPEFAVLWLPGIAMVNARMVSTALTDAFRALRARRVALVSPYPAGLAAASVRYWTAQGFDVAEVVAVTPGGAGAFHPISSMAAGDARLALDRLDGVAGLDAVVMLGTGCRPWA